MRRIFLVTIVLTLSLTLAACGAMTDLEPGDARATTTTSETSSSASQITDVDELRAAVEQANSSAAWLGDLKDMTVETRLGAQVLVLRVGWGAANTDWKGKSDKSQAMYQAVQAYDSPLLSNVAYADADGTYAALGSTGQYGAVPMESAFDLPASPTTAKEFKAWLDAVYGPGGIVTLGADETWYASITSVSMEDSGSGPSLTIATTLGHDDLSGISALQRAIQTTGSPLLTSYAIKGADGYFSGGTAGSGNPGMNGYFYFTE